MSNEAARTVGAIDRIDLAAMIVMAFVAKNTLPANDLPRFLAEVHSALIACDGTADTDGPKAEVEKPSPTQIRKSITPDGLISFIDGKSYTMLKRHLSRHNLDPQGYRERYGLHADYPMTASNYSAKRSALAQAIGLGQRISRAGPASQTIE
ncbi:Transcriptional regulatory protein MucR homolog [Methylorubrum extorquens]|uniref:Transcriptional regulatory protein MucR homolog n=1 Tax=Methylorubrum extorquens TaxID=408 RepID=A0A2N9AK89_METEX|nr:MucR family transcriptional regulator [Methylobacterium sp. Leaf122]SOR27662.1 Transcriptional regulatory protein MucR homolog [Methylorubrum extorquens]